MRIPVLMHRWFVPGGEDWAYHPDLAGCRNAWRVALRGLANGDVGPVGPVPVPDESYVLVGVLTEDPEHPTDRFGRPTPVLRVVALTAAPDAAAAAVLHSRLEGVPLPTRAGASDKLSVPWADGAVMTFPGQPAHPTDPAPVRAKEATPTGGPQSGKLLFLLIPLVLAGVTAWMWFDRAPHPPEPERQPQVEHNRTEDDSWAKQKKSFHDSLIKLNTIEQLIERLANEDEGFKKYVVEDLGFIQDRMDDLMMPRFDEIGRILSELSQKTPLSKSPRQDLTIKLPALRAEFKSIETAAESVVNGSLKKHAGQLLAKIQNDLSRVELAERDVEFTRLLSGVRDLNQGKTADIYNKFKQMQELRRPKLGGQEDAVKRETEIDRIVGRLILIRKPATWRFKFSGWPPGLSPDKVKIVYRWVDLKQDKDSAFVLQTSPSGWQLIDSDVNNNGADFTDFNIVPTGFELILNNGKTIVVPWCYTWECAKDFPASQTGMGPLTVKLEWLESQRAAQPAVPKAQPQE